MKALILALAFIVAQDGSAFASFLGTTATTYEANQKTANRIQMETVANDQTELTAQQVADLGPIAVQCPLEGGEGVYLARALLGNEAAYDDEDACNLAVQPIARQGAKKVELPTFKVYPNPANGYSIIALENVLKEDVVLTMTNAFGVQVLSDRILEGVDAVPIDTEPFPAGTYFLSLKSSAGSQTSILIISK